MTGLKDRFLFCWNKAYLAENPPNGEYYSEEEDSVFIHAEYSSDLQMYRNEKANLGKRYRISTTRQGEFFSEIFHLPNETGIGDLAMSLFEVKNQVLYWTCPKCTAKNNSPTACTACGEPITPEIRAQGVMTSKFIYPAPCFNNYYFSQTSDPVSDLKTNNCIYTPSVITHSLLHFCSS